MSASLTSRQWLFLGGSAVLCGVAALGPHFSPLSPPESTIASRVAEQAALAGSDDQALQELRERMAISQDTEWTDARIRTWMAELGADWHWNIAKKEGMVCEATLERRDLALINWNEVLKICERIERAPGLRLVGAEIVAAGTGLQRRIVTVRFRVRFRAMAPVS